MTTSSSIDIEPLHTILQMECQRDYADTTVIGGLDKYLYKWALQTKNKIENSSQLLAHFNKLQLDKPNYAAWNTEQRKAWIEEVLNWLSEIEKVAETAPAVKGRARLTASEHFSAASRPHSA